MTVWKHLIPENIGLRIVIQVGTLQIKTKMTSDLLVSSLMLVLKFGEKLGFWNDISGKRLQRWGYCIDRKKKESKKRLQIIQG